MDSVRLDVWLWAARMFKTRSQAKQACDAGHVRIDDAPAKPAQPLRVGVEVRVRGENGVRVLRVTALADVRGPAPVARLLYDDLTPPPAAREPVVARRERGSGRPTKRERRETDRWRERD